jgi:hypothetical protein
VRAFLAAATAVFVVTSFTVVASEEARAATASPDAFSIDCSTDTDVISDSADALGVNRIISGGVGDTFTVTNDAAGTDCTVDVDDGSVVTTTGGATTIGANGSLEFEIVASGTFTIASAKERGPVTFNVDACSLDGAGIAADPWRVGSQANFHEIGNVTSPQSCTLSGHYLQTAHLDSSGTGILNNYSEDRVTGEFTGTYDGDHYRISLGGSDSSGWNYNGAGNDGSYSARLSLFDSVNGGTIKKVRVSGNIKSSSALLGGIVGTLSGGGIISEVSSSVGIDSNNDNPVLGGIVGQTGAGGARVQYSRSASDISWVPANTPASLVSIGGIIGRIPEFSAAVREVRDSYYAGDIVIDSSDNDSQSIYLGGIIGSQDDVPGQLVRTYSEGSASDSCVSDCSTSEPDLRAGALIGNGRSDSVFVSNFFLRSGLFQAAVGTAANVPDTYNGSNEPVAVGLSATQLKQIATYTTQEGDSTDEPGGTEMADDASTDFRWAIEGITAQTFVPSSYDDPAGLDEGDSTEIADYTNRVVYASTGERFYPKLRGGNLAISAHNAEGVADLDPASVEGYPALGRVWDICDDYPTLVWENVNSCGGNPDGGGGGGSGGSSSTTSSTSSTTALAAAAGLTEAEYAAFLASGLTLEQFKAARLAATGPDSALLMGSVMGSTLLVSAGLVLIASRRRSQASRQI